MAHIQYNRRFGLTESDNAIALPLPQESKIYVRFGKRALDIGLIVFAAPVLLLVLPILFILGAIDGASPIYTQPRLGRYNAAFRLFKFRSMLPNSNELLRKIISTDPEAAAYWEKHQKLRPDPRVTRVGHFIRKTSLDELPQLWNVLKGDMSLVGPRPMMPDQKYLYPGKHYAMLRPGLTGLWQISERSNSSFADRAQYDSEYYETMSLWTDLKIIMKTFAVVMSCSGE